MTDERNDGGAAFAAMGVGPAGDIYHEHGMSLRDWFAGQIIAGLCANPQCTKIAAKFDVDLDQFRQSFAAEAYRQSDAMLAERQKP